MKTALLFSDMRWLVELAQSQTERQASYKRLILGSTPSGRTLPANKGGTMNPRTVGLRRAFYCDSCDVQIFEMPFTRMFGEELHIYCSDLCRRFSETGNIEEVIHAMRGE